VVAVELLSKIPFPTPSSTSPLPRRVNHKKISVYCTQNHPEL
jgi:hypothetical protein